MHLVIKMNSELIKNVNREKYLNDMLMNIRPPPLTSELFRFCVSIWTWKSIYWKRTTRWCCTICAMLSKAEVFFFIIFSKWWWVPIVIRYENCHLELTYDIVSTVDYLQSMESLSPKAFEVCLKYFISCFNLI